MTLLITAGFLLWGSKGLDIIFCPKGKKQSLARRKTDATGGGPCVS